MNVAALNPTAASRHSDPTISHAEPGKGSEVADFSKSVQSMSGDFSKSVGAVGTMGPPPLKRQHTVGGESRLPTKFGGGKGGKENQQGQGQGRRLLRSSHSGL